MGHASARGRAHSWANQTRHRPDHDAPMTTDQAMAGATAGTDHAPNGADPMHAMSAWVPNDDQGITQWNDQGQTLGDSFYILTGAR